MLQIALNCRAGHQTDLVCLRGEGPHEPIREEKLCRDCFRTPIELATHMCMQLLAEKDYVLRQGLAFGRAGTLALPTLLIVKQKVLQLVPKAVATGALLFGNQVASSRVADEELIPDQSG